MVAYKRHIDTDNISDLTISRLSIYLRCVDQLVDAGVETVSSQQMAKRFNLNSAQIRKDLAYFGEFGVRGVGYNVRELRQYVVEILGLDRERRLVIVGAGNLGSALCHYSGFRVGNFLVVAVLDSDPSRTGDPTPAGLLVEDVDRLPEIVAQRQVEIGIITTPGGRRASSLRPDGGFRSSSDSQFCSHPTASTGLGAREVRGSQGPPGGVELLPSPCGRDRY